MLASILVLVGAAGIVMAGGPLYWDMPSGRSFSECRVQGASVDRDGFLGPGFPHESSLPLAAEVVWRVIDDGDGGFYAGTGHEGVILHLDGEGRGEPLADLDDAEVFSLLKLESGDLVAGCGPEGQVYLIDPQGEVTLFGAVPGGYVWAMTQDPGSDRVWLAVGSPAGLYLLDPEAGTLTETAQFPAENALDVLPDGSGGLLVCTQGPGLVFRVDLADPAEPRLLLETDQREARHAS